MTDNVEEKGISDDLKLVIKALDNKQYEYVCKCDDTILTVKQKISDEIENMNPDRIKLIYKGAVLDNNKLLSSIDSTDGTINYFVMMITKEKKPVQVRPQSPVKNQEPNNTNDDSSTNAVVGNESDLDTIPTPVNNLPLEPTEKQIQIKDHPLASIIQILMMQILQATSSNETIISLLADKTIAEKLANNQTIVAILLEIPEVRQMLLTSSPEIKQLFDMHKDQFESLISHPDFIKYGLQVLESLKNTQGGGMPNNLFGDMSHMTDDMLDDQMAPTYDLSDEDNTNVNDIVSMGFMQSKQEIIQMYVASGKNKELTISMLLDG